MKTSLTILLRSTIALPVLSLVLVASAGADEVRKVPGDNTCPADFVSYPLAAAKTYPSYVCSHLSTWDIARMSGQSSMSGQGYNCEIKDVDTRELGDTLCEPAPAPQPVPAARFNPASTYILRSMFRGEDECLEGNQRASDMQGAAFMSACEPYSGQLWKFEPQDDGFYKLRTVFRGDDECFESNSRESGYMNGSAFMDKCQNVSGQFWKFVPEDDGYFRMKSMFRGEDECLESNLASGGQKGNSFMDKCQNVSGQFWKVETFR